MLSRELRTGQWDPPLLGTVRTRSHERGLIFSSQHYPEGLDSD